MSLYRLIAKKLLLCIIYQLRDLPVALQSHASNPMIYRTHRSVAILLVTLLISLPIGAFAADEITEARVNDLINRVDEAAIRRDIPALLSCFTNDAVITSDWLTEEGFSKKKFNRQEYGTYVKDQFPTATKRELTHSNTKITIADGGAKASVTTETKDPAAMPGTVVSIRTLDAIRLVQLGNELLITSLDIILRDK